MSYFTSTEQAIFDAVVESKKILRRYQGRYGNLNKKEQEEVDIAIANLDTWTL